MTQWPDEKLEKEMLADASLIQARDYGPFGFASAGHIKNLLARVRELETQLTARTDLARQLFHQFDLDVGHAIRSGYWPGLKELYEEGKKQLGEE